MSPGGRTENSPRSRPELLPSSVTVTIAVNDIRGLIPDCPASGSRYGFSPLSRVASPVPPPMATLLIGAIPDISLRFARRFVRAATGIDTFFGPRQSSDRHSINDMRFDNLFYIFSPHASIPDAFRVNHYSGPVFALIETTGAVGSNGRFQSARRQ